MSVLSDLKQLLAEAGQELPEFLKMLAGDEEGTAPAGTNAEKVVRKHLENREVQHVFRDAHTAPVWVIASQIVQNSLESETKRRKHWQEVEATMVVSDYFIHTLYLNLFIYCFLVYIYKNICQNCTIYFMFKKSLDFRENMKIIN